MGVVFATYFAEKAGIAENEYFREVLNWTRPFFDEYVTELRKVSVEAIVDAMKQDKKNVGDQVTFILSRRPGMMEKVAMNAQARPALIGECRSLL